MSKREYILEIVEKLVGDKPTAEMVIDRLQEEGVLHLGYGNVDVDRIVEKFTETYGTTKVSKYDRFSAQRLANKYGSQAIVGIIDMLASLNGEKYAPVVNNVSQLEEKLPSILNFLRKQKGEEVIDV